MTLLSSLIEVSVYSGVLFIGIMFLKSILKTKMSPLLHYVIWGLFLLRLFIPVTLEAPVHLFTYPAQTVPAAQTDHIVNQDHSLASQSPSDISTSQTFDNDPAAPASAAAQTAQYTAPVSSPVRLSATQIVLAVWLGGALVCFIYISVIACLLMHRIKRRSTPASAHLLRLFEDVKAELGIKAKLKLVCQYDYGSPALLFPRTLLIHMDTLAALDDEGIKNCLRHECMHFKHGDHALNLGLTLLNCVYWFNPFVWLACYEMRKDMEVFCDSAVVKHMSPAARRDYAVLILDLSAETRRMQFALGMVRNKKTAMRRIKGVFMEPKSKPRVKLVSAVMALVLAICCFTTACQPTPAEPVVVNKSGGITAEMVADPLPPGAVKEVDAPAHWKQTLSIQNGRVLFNADVDIKIPANLSNTPVYKMEQIPLTQERLAELTHYFIGDSKLYKPLPMTRLDGLIQLQKVKDGSGMYGQESEDTRKLMADKLEEMIADAPANAEKEYTDLTFSPYISSGYYKMLEGPYGEMSMPKTDNYLTVIAETGEDYEPKISASTYLSGTSLTSSFVYGYPGSYMTASRMKSDRQLNELYRGYTWLSTTDVFRSYIANFNKYYDELDDVMAAYTETPDQALQTAQKALTDLGIDNMGLNCIEKGVYLPRQPQEWDELSTSISDGQAGYSLTFERAAGQLAGFTDYYSTSNETSNEMLSYTPPFLPEVIYVFVSNGKILQFGWQNMSQVVETMAQNTNLLPFNKIKSRFTDYITNFYTQYDDPKAEPEESYIIDIIDVQLRASQVPAKDDPYRAWLIPSWVIKYRTTQRLDEGTLKYVYQEFPCEISALDGGIIIQ